MSPFVKRLFLVLAGVAAVAALLGVAWVRWGVMPDLPSTASIRELKLEEPLRIYTRDGKLVGEFGAERRAPLDYEEFPEQVIQAFLAAEDGRFFEHPGVDWQGLARAGYKLLTTGEKAQGGSTITMQLARNVFLSPERTFARKAREILLALQIERDMSKEEILELYLNKIFLGNRAYGVGAAAQVYFGRDPKDLTLAQVALLAGLPKAPSRDNPTANPQRARERRDYVLRRMRELGFVSELDYAAAHAEPVTTQTERPSADVDAHYVAEMVRAELFGQHGDALYGQGLRVTTTIDSPLQAAANEALRRALRDYDERHEYRGPESRLPAEALAQVGAKPEESRALLDAALDALPTVVGLVPAVVVEFTAQALRLKVLTRDHALLELAAEDLEWAALKAGALQRGDIVRVIKQGERWRLTQVPQVQGALVALDPHDGAIRALAGGYDFFEGKFNRVLQARRQPGSGFKPFLYSAALSYGFTPASVILDAPVVFDDPALEDTWRPENYTGKFYGPTRLREALVQSRNLVSIRLLQAIGIPYARNYIAQFGLPADRMPNDLTLALGSASFTPLEIARGYAVFANGGFLVTPHFILEVARSDGTVVFKAAPPVACPECAEAKIEAAAGQVPAPLPAPAEVAPSASAGVNEKTSAPPALAHGASLAPRVAEPRLVYLMRDMMREVVTRGTGAKAAELKRGDLAGKTGTTNDEADAWFNGFNSKMVAIAWVGFDQPKPLGRGEVGGRAALPMWMDFMKVALQNTKEEWPERPSGLVTVRVDPETGKLAAAGAPEAIFELVPAELVPTPDAEAPAEGEAEPGKVEDLY